MKSSPLSEPLFIIHRESIKSKYMLLLVSFISSISALSQSLTLDYTTTKIDYLSLDYTWNLGERHELGGGLRIHINTTIDDDVFSIYYKDFHSFSIPQMFGFGIRYRYSIYSNHYMHVKLGTNVTYFPSLGLRRYVVAPIGILPDGNVIYSLDEISGEEGGYAATFIGLVEINARLTDDIYLNVSGGFRTLINNDFSNNQYILNVSGGYPTYSFAGSFGLGLSYNFNTRN